MITTQPQQESTFLQDLQTGLDQFQSDDKLQADLLLDVQRGQAKWSDLQHWVEQSQVIPWLHDLESRCIAQGRKFRVWSAQGGSIQDKIQTRAWG